MHYRIMKKDELDKYLPGFTRSRMYASMRSQIESWLGQVVRDRDAICCLNSNDAIVAFKNSGVEILSTVILKCEDDNQTVYQYHEWKGKSGVPYEQTKKEEKPKENTVKLSDKLFRRRKIILLRTDS